MVDRVFFLEFLWVLKINLFYFDNLLFFCLLYDMFLKLILFDKWLDLIRHFLDQYVDFDGQINGDIEWVFNFYW